MYNYDTERCECLIEELSNQERVVIENLINELSFTSPLGAEEYITIDNEGISNTVIPLLYPHPFISPLSLILVYIPHLNS